MQFYPKVLPSFTHAIAKKGGLKWENWVKRFTRPTLANTGPIFSVCREVLQW